MSVGAQVFARLAADAAVQQYLGTNPTRLFPSRLPPNLTLPYPAATYLVVDDIEEPSLDGCTSGLHRARVQIDLYAPAYDDAQALADAVDDVLKARTEPGWKSRRLMRRDLWEAEGGTSGLHRVAADFAVEWSE